MDDAAAVEMCSIATAEIDEREFRAALRVNERVTTRDFVRGKDDVVVLGATERKCLPDKRELAIADI